MKRVTAKDVAASVGCSVSAVSLVVNDRDRGRVNPRLRHEILDAIAVLDYRPNETARGLAIRTPATIALVCPDIRNPFFGELFHGLVDGLHGTLGVDLKVGAAGGDYGSAEVRAAQAANIAGLVLANPSPEVLEGFRGTCPTVLIDSPGATGDVRRVDLDLDSAARQLAQHLLDLGHTTVGYIDFFRPKDTFDARRTALGRYLTGGGATLLETSSAFEISVAAGRRSFIDNWAEWERQGTTAVVAADDVLAYGVLAGAADLGLAVPDAISVASFNDLDYSALTAPPLTSVAFDPHALGVQAAEVLQSLLGGGPGRNVVVPTHLVTRQSTGAPRDVRRHDLSSRSGGGDRLNQRKLPPLVEVERQRASKPSRPAMMPAADDVA